MEVVETALEVAVDSKEVATQLFQGTTGEFAAATRTRFVRICVSY